jgi:plastocyanin
MKKIIAILVLAIGFSMTSNAQDSMTKTSMKKDAMVSVISLVQTPGEFTQKKVMVAPGSYVFEIENRQAGTDVGFVLVPKGKDVSNADNHIKTAYVTSVVKEGTKQKSNVTKLAKGEYVYFCPLNKTATDNVLIVQ